MPVHREFTSVLQREEKKDSEQFRRRAKEFHITIEIDQS